MRRGALIAATALFAAVSARATEWQVLGPRAMGMGGAGVAVPNGPLSSYWNPASLSRSENPSGFQVPVGALANVDGQVIKAANDFENLAKACQSLNASVCTSASIQNALSELANKSNGLRVDAGGGLNLKFGHLAVFADNLSYFGARPGYIDQVNDTTMTFQNNTSSIVAQGFLGTELGIGYGLKVPLIPGLAIGGDIKAIDGVTSYDSSQVGQNGTSQVFKTPDTKTSIEPGVDISADWDMDKTFKVLPFRPLVGITAHNINDPKFAMPDSSAQQGGPSKFSYQGNTRAGAELRIANWWTVAGDLDLTRNVTMDGTESQMVALGTEINIVNRPDFNIPLRAGVNENLASGVKALSLGAGIDLIHVNIDAAVTASPATQSIQSQGKSQSIPESLGAEIQLGVLFGGSEKDVK